MFKRLFSAALVFGAAAIAPPALAQNVIPCGLHDLIAAQLITEYNETRIGAGLQNPQTLMEIWTSAETGSWTVLIIRPNGVACVVASGGNWHTAPIEVKKGTPG